jgi:Tol biopolymer transport system component
VDDSGGLIYTAAIGGQPLPALYRLPPGGAQPILVAERVKGFAATRDGKVLVVANSKNALIRMKVDGSSPAILVETNAAVPTLTPDGQTVLFSPYGPGLLSVPLLGGAPRKLSDRWVLTLPVVSPDGKRVAFDSDNPGTIVVCDLPDCTNSIQLEVETGSGTRGFGWAPDSSGIAFSPIDDRPNIWVHPLDGGPRRPLTHFDASEPSVWEFSWSSDGKYLALSRGRFFDDLLLIKGLR